MINFFRLVLEVLILVIIVNSFKKTHVFKVEQGIKAAYGKKVAEFVRENKQFQKCLITGKELKPINFKNGEAVLLFSKDKVLCSVLYNHLEEYKKI